MRAILDLFLQQHPGAKVACESFVADGLVVMAGEFATTPGALFDVIRAEMSALVRQVIRETGYTGASPGIDPERREIRPQLNAQSADIHRGVEQGEGVLGAGDQGLVFGYATGETPERMPLSLVLAHRLTERHAAVRRSGVVPWLRPDAKSLVSVRYRDGEPQAVETVVLSTQHAEEVGIETVRRVVEEHIVSPVVPAALRSAAYLARYIAKNIVATALARRCTLQLTYAIGVAAPVLDGTGAVSAERLEAAIPQLSDLTPAGIIRTLDLRRPIYRQTAAYGHFARELPDFTCERIDQAEALRRQVG